jgi:hypothetical protein
MPCELRFNPGAVTDEDNGDMHVPRGPYRPLYYGCGRVVTPHRVNGYFHIYKMIGVESTVVMIGKLNLFLR